MFRFSPGSHMSRSCVLGLAVVAGSLLLSAGNVSRADGEVAPSIKKESALYKQSLVLTVAKPADGAKLEDFCTDQEGRILALLGPAGRNGAVVLDESGEVSVLGVAASLLGGSSKKTPKFEPAVHVYDAAGKLLSKWEVGFPGQAINTAPDGTVLVGGDGRVARFDLSGKKLLEVESPQMTYIKTHQDDMRERAKEQLKSDREMYAEQVTMFEDQLKELRAKKAKQAANKAPAKKAESDPKSEEKPDAKPDSEAPKTPEPAKTAADFNERNLEQILKIYQQQVQNIEKKTVEMALEEVTRRARQIHAITANKDHVFVTCPAMAGYGYGVWRTDKEFGQAKEIVKSLSGCCGQMDVQCRGEELYVCENSRHRVVRFDFDGKELGHFGKRDREGEGENFGGCCNPMNLCFSKAGNLFVSESNGVVKHFTPEGKYLGVVGVAKVQAGCKNSCVAVNVDESRLFYIDIYQSKIIVLDRGKEQASR